ncbi:MAG: OmpH/Skp family outer membrane protein [Planctomycetota bacterium]|jgi:Skp family chaperone for outer membrane proteins
MNRLARSLRLPSLLLAAVAVTAVVYDSVGARTSVQQPTTTATVNLARVLDGLEQRADAEVRLNGMAEEVRAERDRREAEMKQLQDQLAAATDPKVAIGIEEQLALASLNFQAWVRFKTDQLDIERALLLQDLYRSIKQSIAELAETEGYDLVVVDDSQGELGWSNEARLSREAQILQQIRGRRLLYTTSGIDITDDLVARMNNKFRMGTG